MAITGCERQCYCYHLLASAESKSHPSGRQESTPAVVNRLKRGPDIWDVSSPGSGSVRGRSGQKILTPFYFVDLQFTPAGEVRPVHAVDRVDSNESTLQLHRDR